MQIYEYLLKNRQSLFYWAAFLFLFAFSALLFTPFIVPLFLAGIFSLALNHYVIELRKFKYFKSWAPVAVFCAFVFLLVIPFTIFLFKIYSYAREVSEESGLQNTLARVQNTKAFIAEHLRPLLVKLDIQITEQMKSAIEKGLTQFALGALDFLKGAISQIPATLFMIFIFLLALLYFMLRSSAVRSWFLKSRICQFQESQNFIRILSDASYAAVSVTVMVGAVQALIVAFGALFFDAGDFVIVLIMTFFFSFIPIIGAAPMAFILSFLQFAQGNSGHGIGMLIVAVISGTIDNIIRPYFISRSDNGSLHPILALVALLGAIQLMGFPGLFIGPMLLHVTVQLFKQVDTMTLGVFPPLGANPPAASDDM